MPIKRYLGKTFGEGSSRPPLGIRRVNKNEIAADNSIKLIDTSLTEISVETSTQTKTGGLTLRELRGLDKELRTISGSLRSAISKSMAKQFDIYKEKKKIR